MNKEIFVSNENKWIATDLEYKKLIASKKDLAGLQKMLKKLNIKNAVVMFVPPFNKSLTP